MKHIIPCITAGVVLTAFNIFAGAVDPVCIIGAGPAGLTVANRLESKGYETIIFEKNPEVGGKCQTYYNKGFPHPMGAAFFSNETYRETLPIIDASGQRAIPFSNFSNGHEWLYDPKSDSGSVWKSSVLPTVTSSPLFQAEVNRYTNFWNTEFAPLAVVGYKNGVKGYTSSAFEWLHNNNYPLLLLIFIQGMVPYGYGDVTEVPMIYMLQYFTPDILRTISGQQSGYIIDFHQVFVKYASSSIKGPIYLNTPVTKIDRSGDFPVVSYNESLTQKCGKLVLAFPPVMHALNVANLDLDQDETTIFSPVGIIKYWSGAVHVNTPYGETFLGYLDEKLLEVASRVLENNTVPGEEADFFRDYLPWLPKASGAPMSSLRIFSASDIANTWSWGSNQTLDEARNLLRVVLSRFNKDPNDPNATPKQIIDTDVVDFREWDYFPHFNTQELDNDFYAKFNALQGHKNTYYASGLNGFETVEFAIRAGQDVVDSYILPQAVPQAGS